MDGLNALIATAGGYRPPEFDLQSAQGNALKNQLMQQELQAQPQRMQMAEQELRLKELAFDVKTKALQSKGSISLDYPTFTITGDSDAVAAVADAVARFPDQVNDPQFLPWVAQQKVSIKAREAKAAEAPKTRNRQEGSQEITEEWTGTEWKKIGGGPKWNPKGEEFEITTDKEGHVSIRKGPAGAGGSSGMTKPTQTKIEGKLFDATNSLERLKQIETSFKPEFLTYKSKLGQQVTSWKAKAGMEISPEEKQSRQEFSTFKRRSISNMNQYLNELSGAAITEQEAIRLTKALPNPGTGIFDGDDPIDFESKMRDVMEEAKLSIARYNYLLANGWNDQQIIGNIKKEQIQSIGSFRSQIQARIKEIQEEERKAGTYEGDIPGIVKQKIRQEFKL